MANMLPGDPKQAEKRQRQFSKATAMKHCCHEYLPEKYKSNLGACIEYVWCLFCAGLNSYGMHEPHVVCGMLLA